MSSRKRQLEVASRPRTRARSSLRNPATVADESLSSDDLAGDAESPVHDTPKMSNEIPDLTVSGSNYDGCAVIDLDSSPIKLSKTEISPKSSGGSPKKRSNNTPSTENKQSKRFKLDSSPIKPKDDTSRESSPIIDRFLNSSPNGFKKTVAFSDDLVSDVPSSPARQLTPRKSILKVCNISCNEPSPNNPNDTSLWVKEPTKSESEYGPANAIFWLQGTIVQLPSNSSDLPQLVAGCIHVLHGDNFRKRFEVYATLNNIYKSNSNDILLKLFTISKPGDLSPIKARNSSTDSNYIIELTGLIRRDIVILEEELFQTEQEANKENTNSCNNDPFTIRIINQALKLMNFLMLDQELNNFIPLDEVKWFYRHSCAMLSRPNTSKALIAPYLLIIKDCKFNSKKKKIILDNTEIPEKMLQSLINMKSFPSSSIVTEKFVCFKNFVVNFPQVMAKQVDLWFGILIMNIVNLSAPFFTKCIGIGINTLLEVAKAFLDNKTVHSDVREFLNSPLPTSIRSLSSDSSVEFSVSSPSFSIQKDLAVDYIILKLDELIEAQEYKSALDTWIALTLLVGDAGSGFDKWPHLNKWLRVPKVCFNSQNLNARIISINSWRAIMYNLCHNDLDDLKKVIEPIMRQYNVKDRQSAVNNALKQKIKLVTHLFSNIESSESQREVIDSLNNIFLALLYNLVNPIAIKQNPKYLHIYWDKIIQPILLNFYFKKNTSNSYMNQLGIRILTKLLKNSMPVNERTFSEIRCLANDPVTLNEINSLPARWIYSKFDRIMHNVVIVFESNEINVDQKINFFNIFLNNLKLTTKKEIKVSDATFDIIDNIPYVLDALFKSNNLSFDMAYKLIINLKDTFDPSSLINRNEGHATGSDTNVYKKVIQNCLQNLNPSQVKDIINLTFASLNERKLLVLILDLCKLNKEVQNVELGAMLSQAINNRSITKEKAELNICGEICQVLTSDFEIFVKKLIQSVVSIANSEELKQNLEYLGIQKWNLSLFKYFILLVHNAPSPYIQQFTIDCILKKSESKESFIDLTQFLIESSYDFEILQLREQILQESKNLEGFLNFEFESMWKTYLQNKFDAKEYEVLDQLLTVTCTVTEYDVAPYTVKIWDHLPLLKAVWTKPFDSYEEIEMEQEETTTLPKDTSETQIKASNHTESTKIEAPIEEIKNSALEHSQDHDEEQESQVKKKAAKRKAKSTSKAKSKKGKKAKKAKSVEVGDQTQSFDIHSFTAMLNKKLSSTPSKKELEQTNATPVSPTIEGTVDSPIEIHGELQVPSSLGKEENISQININPSSKDSGHDTKSKETSKYGKHAIDYSKIMQSGFLDTESKHKQSAAEEATIENSKKSKVSSEEIESSIEDSQKRGQSPEKAEGQDDSSSGESYKNSMSSSLNTFESANFKSHSTAISDRSFEFKESDMSPIKEADDLVDVYEDYETISSSPNSESAEFNGSQYADEFPDSDISIESITPGLESKDEWQVTGQAEPNQESSTKEVKPQQKVDESEVPDSGRTEVPTEASIDEETVTTVPMESSTEESESRQLDTTPLPPSSLYLNEADVFGKALLKRVEDGKIESRVTVLPSSSVQDVASMITSITDEDISQLSGEEKFQLETELMKFMLRMRGSTGS